VNFMSSIAQRDLYRMINEAGERGERVVVAARAHRQFDTLPVVVITSSKHDLDVDKSRELGVSDYRVKPHAYEDLVRLLDDVRKCWLDEGFNRHVPQSR